MNTPRQLIRFFIIGCLNVFIDLGVFNILFIFIDATNDFSLFLIRIISGICAVINSYTWNKVWIFQNKEKYSITAPKFFIVSYVGLLVNTGFFMLSFWILETLQLVQNTYINTNIAFMCATGISLFWNFLGYKLLVFRK